MLHGLLAPGASRPDRETLSAWIPPANQIALLATLAIHPTHTNRPSEREDVLVSAQALRYLTNLLSVVGPVNANLRSAFQFVQGPRGGRRGYGADADLSGEDDSGGDEAIGSRFAADKSVWARGQDFWKIVGWAFTCSVLHPERWRYWKPWLEYMVDVLEKDSDERARRDGVDKEASPRPGSSDGYGYPFARQSLIMAYLDKCKNRVNLRQIVKALLADGGPMSLPLFQEVFDRETQLTSKGAKKRKREVRALDLENDEYGDYCDNDSPPSSQVSQASPPARSRGKGRNATRHSAATVSGPTTNGPVSITGGFVESIPLRLRLFYQVC